VQKFPNSVAQEALVVMNPFWQTSRFQIDLTQPQVMGIVNVTPDSFSDGGAYFSSRDTTRVLAHCEQLLKEGADILDIGGESTRPGAVAVPLDQELARVLPVLRHAVQLGVPISVDTYKPEVMQAALDLGADIVNDVWALRQPGAVRVVTGHPQCGVCLMHMHREPLTMQAAPMTGDVLQQVRGFLQLTAQGLQAAGVAHSRIVLDAGVGFGKTLAQNLSLLQRQSELLSLGFPLLVGWSRKSSLAMLCADLAGGANGADGADTLTPLPMAERMLPSIAAALLAVERGARLVRVHDVRETVQALKIWTAASM
jgi:dihydropteroate synthase